jgi:predicted Fe-Mo cluster-binding NifX family protein
MKLLAIPNFGDRISPRIDYAETLQLITVEDKKVLRKDTIKIIAHSNLERINQIIRLKPDVVICDGISNLLQDKLIENKIEIVAWIHGIVDDIVEKYLNGKI